MPLSLFDFNVTFFFFPCDILPLADWYMTVEAHENKFLPKTPSFMRATILYNIVPSVCETAGWGE